MSLSMSTDLGVGAGLHEHLVAILSGCDGLGDGAVVAAAVLGYDDGPPAASSC